MRKGLLFVLVLMTMMCTSTALWAAEVQFTFSYYNNFFGFSEVLLSEEVTVTLYKSGETVAQGRSSRYDEWNNYYTGIVTLEVDDALLGQTVAYRSSLGHEGTMTLTSGAVKQLDCKKLTIALKGADLTSQIYISKADGTRIKEFYLGSEEIDELYLAQSDGYTYSDSRGKYTGSFDLTDDYTLTIGEIASDPATPATPYYKLTVRGRYGDFPVSSNNSWGVYRYGATSDYVGSISSYSSYVKVPSGSYLVRDDYGVFSQEIVVTEDVTAWLEYRKVTFKSMMGNEPNANQTIKVLNSKGDGSKTLITNSKGEASTYLLAGNYRYMVAGGTEEFSVSDADQTVNINTSRVTIMLTCDDSAELTYQNFKWGRGEYNHSTSYSFTDVTPVDGKIVIDALPGKYKLIINSLSEVDVEVAAGDNQLTVPLYYVMFTTNLTTARNVYIYGNADIFRNSVGINNKFYLPAGEYYYSSFEYSSSGTFFTLSQNKTIALNYATLTITVKDTDNKAVSGEEVSISGAYRGSTDQNGQATYTALAGSTYEVTVGQYATKTIVLTDDAAETLTIPAYVNFSVTRQGKPYSGSLKLSKSTSDKDYIYISEGKARARIAEGELYSVNRVQGAVTISEGTEIRIGTLSVASEGMGLAFPMDNFNVVGKWDVILGSAVRLTAIEAGGNFQKWVINGTDNTNQLIDLTLNSDETTATAVFDAASSTRAPQMKSAMSLNSDDNYIYLPEGTEGTARIYTLDGKLVKSIGVLGSKVGIYDLPANAYLFSLSSEGGVQSGRFMKK